MELQEMHDIIFITSFYKARLAERRAEYNKCLEINSNNSNINQVIVFFEGDESDSIFYPALQHDIVHLIFIKERPTYALLVDYANKNLAGKYVVISNADIYFDQDSNIERVRELKLNQMWALSRYNFCEKSKMWEEQKSMGSYDSYLFIPPIKNIGYDIFIGVLGCDSYFVQKSVENGLRVMDPALSIISKHQHRVAERNHYLIQGNKPTCYWDKEDYGDGHRIFMRNIRSNIYSRGLFFPVLPRYPRASLIEDSSYVTSKPYFIGWFLYCSNKCWRLIKLSMQWVH